VPGPEVQTVVPFLDLGALNAPLKHEILAAFEDLIERSEFGSGETVAAFEQSFADACGAPQCVGTASGLDAVRLALVAAGMQLGDEVIVPANTFIATFEAVTQAGGVPVPVDASLADYNLDAEAVEAAVSPRTRFLLPVHLYGQLADMRCLNEVAQRHDLRIVEDAAQAHGASRDGIVPGGGTMAAAFSFYPGKNLGAMGDAGAVVTDDARVAGRVRMLREHGQSAKYRHELIGWTSRLDAFQAAVLLAKLPHLQVWNEERREVARLYGELLQDIGDLLLPPVAPASNPVWHLYVVRTAAPERLAAHLRDRGIQTGRHYPEPVHLSQAYRHLGHEMGTFPVTEKLANELVSLPIFPGMTEGQVEVVAQATAEYFARG